MSNGENGSGAAAGLALIGGVALGAFGIGSLAGLKQGFQMITLMLTNKRTGETRTGPTLDCLPVAAGDQVEFVVVVFRKQGNSVFPIPGALISFVVREGVITIVGGTTDSAGKFTQLVNFGTAIPQIVVQAEVSANADAGIQGQRTGKSCLRGVVL